MDLDSIKCRQAKDCLERLTEWQELRRSLFRKLETFPGLVEKIRLHTCFDTRHRLNRRLQLNKTCRKMSANHLHHRVKPDSLKPLILASLD
jgi:hypothetical protein